MVVPLTRHCNRYVEYKRNMRNIFILPKFASAKNLKIEHDVATIYELHMYELFKSIVDCLRQDLSANIMNNILKQVPERGYEFRSSCREPLCQHRVLRSSIAACGKESRCCSVSCCHGARCRIRISYLASIMRDELPYAITSSKATSSQMSN